MEGEFPAVITAPLRQLTVQRRGIHPDSHGGELKAAFQNRVPHENVTVEIPVVIVRGTAVMGLTRSELLANLHQEHGVMLPADRSLPLVGGQVREPVFQLLRGDEVDFPVRDKGENREGIPQCSSGVADGTHNVPHGVLKIPHVAVGRVNMFFPVPLIHVNGVEVVHLFIPADGVHIGIKAGAGLELITLEGQTLPLGQRVYHLPLGAHIGDVEGDRALHTVQVIVQTGLAVHEKGSRDPVQVEPDREAVLKLAVDQLNGPL
ncbi:unknown [Oscillibacter sp. CAG:155]|nr:unknown [Oscillibacter sp. CAG:155]